ncbi:TonB-dependent receptor [Terriglobus aquaticus]|uniref:Carboxypeptidase regulatory-like domain-containing protein n=1 Tax=Terriglobus aquaticus TaxID=940139 RepID=A0ABW9KMZ3_9BACT|nr:carboxypeptidase regulatory-like domain-containing protein [Terriglobus aquaticus]
MKKFVLAVSLATAAVSVIPITMAAQATATGSVVGVVTDPSGAAIAGASVTVTAKGTNAERKTTTNGAGQYRFDLLPAGDYMVHVTAAGFATTDTSNLTLQVGATTTANVPLTTGSVNTTVDVATVNQLLDAEKTDSSTNVTPQQVQELPLNGRDFANLAILAPGVKLVDSYDPTKNRYAVYAVNGSSGRNTNTTVNGIDNKDNTVGGAVMQLPLEAVQEFKISTARFSAENGRSEGAALNVITKSGTNQFHGSLFGFFRSDAIQNKNYFDEQAKNPKPAYSRQQYGGSIGGPILKDRDFGFFAYEGLRERSSLSVDAASFAELTLAIPLGAVPAHTIGTPFDEKRYNGRIDHQFSDKEHLYFSYAAQDNKSQNDQSTNQVDTTEGNFTINDLILANVTLDSVLSSKAVNNFTAGFQYWNNLIDSTIRKPYFTFPDGASFGTNANVPQKSSQHKFQFRDDFSYSLSKHTLRTGVDVLYEPQVGGFFENNPTPEFDFYETAQQILSNADGHTPNGFASAGAIASSTGTSGDPRFNLSPKMVGVYFQDDWRLSNRLLLNLGIRYDKDINTYGIDKQANSRTYQELLAATASGVSTVPSVRANQAGGGYTPSLSYIGGNYNGLPQNDNKDISPRVGFSYDLSGNGRFVVRGGYGLYFGQSFENIPLFMIQQANAAVFANTYSISCAGPTDTGCSSANVVPGTNILLSRYRYGVDPAPVIPAASFNLAAGSTGRLMAPNYRNPYTQQINFGFQYAPTASSVVEVEYVQARGLHENKTLNINPTQYFAGGARPFSAAFAKAGVPVLGRIAEEASIGRSYYDGLNLSYRAQLKKYVSATVNYTYAAALAFEGASASFRNTATNPFLGALRDQDFGFVPNNETHHLTAAGTFFTKYGIEISPILQAGSSRPLDPEISTDLWSIGSGRTNAHAPLAPGAKPTLANFVNEYQALVAQAAALTASTGATVSVGTVYRNCLAAGTCVESHYNTLRGIPDIQLDARVGDTITLHERYKLNLFFQGFNLTNRANFGANYVGNINSYAAGSTALNPAGFINPSSTVIPRAFTGEFGARFSF